MARVHSTLRSFGAQLRQIREECGLNGKQLAEILTWSPSKVSKIETGRQTITADEVIAWLHAANRPDLRDEFLAALRETRIEYATWKDELAQGQAEMADLEVNTTSARIFEPFTMPGLLQTGEYARHVLAGIIELHQLGADIGEATRARVERQEVLYREGHQFRFLVAEAALYHYPCPPHVMHGQLDRLIVLDGLQSVQIRILPFGAVLPRPLGHGYGIYDNRLVRFETIAAEVVIRDPDQVALYSRIYDRLWELGLHGYQMRELLARVSQSNQASSQ